MKEKIKLIGIFTIIALVFSIPVVYQRKLGAHGGIGPDNTGQADTYRFYPSEIMGRPHGIKRRNIAS